MFSARFIARHGRPITVAFVAAFLPAVTTDCSFQIPGTFVEVAFESTVLPERVGEMTVDFERAFLAVEEVELVRCEDGWRAWRWFPSSTAYAHSITTPTQLGTTVAVDLTDSSTLVGGLLEPPGDRYCGVRVRVAPADGDAVGAVVEERRSLFVQGTARTSEVDTPLLWRSSSVQERWLPLDPPLVLDEANLRYRVTIVARPDLWFSGSDLESATMSMMSSARLLERTLDTMQVRYEVGTRP